MRHLLLILIAACRAPSPDGADTDADAVDTDPAHTDTDADPAHTDPPDTDPAHTDPPDTDTDPPADPWGCPAPDPYGGDAGWPLVLDVPTDVVLCSSFSEFNDLEQDLALKLKLRIPAGTYRFPGAGEATVRFPACTLGPDGLGPAPVGDGTVAVQHSDGVAEVWTVTVTHPVDGLPPGAFLRLRSRFEAELGATPPPLVLTGDADELGAMAVEAQLCADESCWAAGSRRFIACAPTAYARNLHEVTFEGGAVTLTLDIGQSWASTEPAAFVRAQGTLDGAAFDVTEPFQLMYAPAHHHFSRDFAVLFDAPVGKAAGLAVTGVDPWGDDPPTVVRTVDPALATVETREVTGETHTKP